MKEQWKYGKRIFYGWSAVRGTKVSRDAEGASPYAFGEGGLCQEHFKVHRDPSDESYRLYETTPFDETSGHIWKYFN